MTFHSAYTFDTAGTSNAHVETFPPVEPYTTKDFR